MKCKKCNAEHDGSYGSGKFCCRACANSRIRTDEIKEKTSTTIKQGIKEGRITTGHAKGVKHKTARSKEHCEKISENVKAHWDRKGRKIIDPVEGAKLNVLHVQNYRAKKYKATPVDVDKKLVRTIYENCPTGYEVDHIIPLCEGGLHHPDNFQYLPALENRRKNKTQNYDKSLAIKWQDIITIP